MIVEELIEKLRGCNPNAEVGWEIGTRDLDLLIGEDPDTGESITIQKPDWQ